MLYPQFQRAYDIIVHDLYEHGDDGESYPVPCQLHDSFCGLDGTDHNCLGCNFADATHGILRSLHKIVKCADDDEMLEHDYVDFLFPLYLFIERADTIIGMLGLPENYRSERFRHFTKIRRWANFFKHPNFFVFVHHPDYYIEGSPTVNESEYSLIIDSNFVIENCGGGDKMKKGTIRRSLENKSNVAVKLPDPEKLAEEFCVAALSFVSLITDNKAYQEILEASSTSENYFRDPDENQTS